MTDDSQKAASGGGETLPSTTGYDGRVIGHETIVDAVGDGVYQLDLDGCFVSVNDSLLEMAGYDRDQLLGEHVSVLLDEQDLEAGVADIQELLESGPDAVRTREMTLQTAHGERVPVEVRFSLFEADGEVQGTVGCVRELRHRREVGRRLRDERDMVEQTLEAVPVSVVVIESDGKVVQANEQAAERLGIDMFTDERATLGDWDVYDEDGTPAPPEKRPYRRVFETGEPVRSWQCQIDRPDRGRRWLSISAAPLFVDESETEVGRVIVAADDVTRVREQTRQLRRQRDELADELDEIFERIDDAFYALDDEFRFTYVNDKAEELIRRDEEELLGREVWEEFPEATETVVWESFHEAMETGEPVQFELYYDPLEFWADLKVYPSESGLSVYFRDITERKQREQELERYETIVEAVRDGIYTVDDEGRFIYVNEAYAELLGYDREELLGEPSSKVAPAEAIAKAQAAERALRTSEADVSGDPEVPTVETAITTADGESVPVAATLAPLPPGAGGGRTGVVRDITERKRRKQELERQREQLAALNTVNEIGREVVDAVIDQSTREQVEQVVCELLADSDRYRFAWIGDVDPRSDAVEARVAAGSEGYVDDLEISADPDDPTGQGPTARAFRTGEVQVVRNVLEESEYEPWRNRASEYGFYASAAIPITYEETLYGVLNLYTDQVGALGEAERDVIGQLGEVIGHAINAIERKRALLSDEVVELEFQVRNFLDGVDAPPPTEGRITFDRTVALGEDGFLLFGRATGDAFETLQALVDAMPHFEEITVLHEGSDEVRYRLRLDEPPVLSVVAARGGRIPDAVIEDGDLQVTAELPPEVGVRRITDAVEETYPGAEIIAQRQITRTGEREAKPAERIRETLTETLTDRQRKAIELAYYEGFFDWPRETTGEEIADAMGISSPTYHQHLRTGQRKVFDALFDGEQE